MVYQRGRKFVYLLEHKCFVLEHEISCSSTKCCARAQTVCSSTKCVCSGTIQCVLQHEIFVLGHDLVRALAQNIRARARMSSCPSKKFRARSRTRSWQNTNSVLEQKNKLLTPLVHHRDHSLAGNQVYKLERLTHGVFVTRDDPHHIQICFHHYFMREQLLDRLYNKFLDKCPFLSQSLCCDIPVRIISKIDESTTVT